MEQYAQLGLRTLCLAWRDLEEEEYHEWSLLFKEANSSLVDREVRNYFLWFMRATIDFFLLAKLRSPALCIPSALALCWVLLKFSVD